MVEPEDDAPAFDEPLGEAATTGQLAASYRARLTDRTEWIKTAQHLAEEIDREIERHGTDIDIWWIQDKARDVAWHCRDAVGDPGPHVPAPPEPR